MANIIEIIEQNNRLDFANTYTPIVCGNSNYYLKFTLSTAWQLANKKAAVFVVDGKRQVVDFDGNECKVPILPNAEFVFVSLVSGDGENQLITTPIRIRLERNSLGGDLSEFDQTASYLSKVLGAINKIENGDIDVKSSKFANNVSNPNLLINGNFKVNQRAQNSYSAAGYSVDRWQIGENATLSVQEDGITFASTGETFLCQKMEGVYAFLAGKTLALSAKINGVIYSVSGVVSESKPTANETTFFSRNINENGINGELKFVWLKSPACYSICFECREEQTLKFEFVKLEVGDVATCFQPRLYAEELALCQRFCVINNDTNYNYNNFGFGVSSSTTQIDVKTSVPATLRTLSTIKYIVNNQIVENIPENLKLKTYVDGVQSIANAPTNISMARINGGEIMLRMTGTFLSGMLYSIFADKGDKIKLIFDSEIY